MVYVSRYSNPTLKSGLYKTIRISIGTPKWNLGYRIDGEFGMLMPYGLLNNYDEYDEFKEAYFRRLDKYGITKIRSILHRWSYEGKDIVLLCFEDIRKDDQWCHRTAFAEWWESKTGEKIKELYDPTPAPKTRIKVSDLKSVKQTVQQMSMF